MTVYYTLFNLKSEINFFFKRPSNNFAYIFFYIKYDHRITKMIKKGNLREYVIMNRDNELINRDNGWLNRDNE
jgi:hypothetical protein